MITFNQAGLLSLSVVVAILTTGCGQSSEPSGTTNVVETSTEEGHDHGGWWCTEHGVPEEDCSLCSSTAADAFKAKGDWCKEHNRAESQCFHCDPSRAEKFAKLYEAKFGSKPPEATE